jgi:hypothetical protein
LGQADGEYKQFLEERKLLIDAARESARTFDKAVLAFGSAVFGFSIAFVKDIAPKPYPDTLPWLGASWVLFAIGLLAILLSFLFSHRACMFEIEVGGEALGKRDYTRKRNPWSLATNFCNVSCVAFLFFGLICWSIFAYKNLHYGATTMDKPGPPKEERGYVPPRKPPKPLEEGYVPPPTPPKPPPKPTPKPPPKK